VSDYTFIHINRENGTTVKSFKTASRAKSTIVTVEIEVIESYALGDLLTQLHEAKNPPKPKPAARTPQDERLALPAPALQLCDLRGDGR
jgi:hypothetical protein